MDALIRKKDWLLPVTLILFLAAAVLTPFAVELTYAGRNEAPGHILTYTTNQLTWDSSTHVNEETGAAELSLFSSTYENVQAENTDKVIAPGTEGRNIVRLKNNADNQIQYIAVMYRIKAEETLPVEPVMEDDAAFTDAHTYPLPEGVAREQVIKAVTGSVAADQIQDFEIAWLWQYYENEERDRADTLLGNKAAWAAADEVQAGLYIVVTENYDPDDPDGSYTHPKLPQTGDPGGIALYLTLLSISGILLLLLLLERRREKQCKKS